MLIIINHNFSFKPTHLLLYLTYLDSYNARQDKKKVKIMHCGDFCEKTNILNYFVEIHNIVLFMAVEIVFPPNILKYIIKYTKMCFKWKNLECKRSSDYVASSLTLKICLSSGISSRFASLTRYSPLPLGHTPFALFFSKFIFFCHCDDFFLILKI